MGDFNVHVQAVGGHGCQREKKNGEVVEGCGQQTCVDCITRRYVTELKNVASVKVAVLTHWPVEVAGYTGQDEVRDNLLTNIRHGSF